MFGCTAWITNYISRGYNPGTTDNKITWACNIIGCQIKRSAHKQSSIDGIRSAVLNSITTIKPIHRHISNKSSTCNVYCSSCINGNIECGATCAIINLCLRSTTKTNVDIDINSKVCSRNNTQRFSNS